MVSNVTLGPLGMGVLAGAEMIRTGLLSGNLLVATAGVIICGLSLVLGYAVARPQQNKPNPDKGENRIR